MTAVLLAALVLSCAIVVAMPLLRPARVRALVRPEVVEALEERDRALAALRELELDHRAGTVGDAEYRALVGALRVRATKALLQVEDDG